MPSLVVINFKCSSYLGIITSIHYCHWQKLLSNIRFIRKLLIGITGRYYNNGSVLAITEYENLWNVICTLFKYTFHL